MTFEINEKGEKNTCIFKDLQEQGGKSVAMVQMSIIEGITRWTSKLVKKHIVSETSLQLHKIIINEHNKGNHFKTWNDAFWYYTWLEGNERSQHCV